MKLKSWKLHPIRLPYFRAIKWADVVEESADFLLLELESDTGARGRRRAGNGQVKKE